MPKEQRKGTGSRTYVLKFDMHCQCNGCVKKINDGLKEISRSEGVKRADLLVETGEVKVIGSMDPEKLCCLLHEVTKKRVKIVTQSTLSEGRIATSQQTKNLFGQAPSDSFTPEAGEISSRWQNGLSSFPITPSAPPLPEAWSQTAPSERCWYRWSAPSSTLGMWVASDITGTLAMYEL
ncbi:heavy metal-associated isoprenylated plant protein 19-like [Phragmites australis]|uniref:heavy metal-associated isoprenylated plant protein 19-like n=1 Tax=Phragmites australis TaxID=29695 RepID=UPI002D76B812|nr:heavy metal-associated isoprenylated plant protein 19-like [Phragmites australis]